MSPNLPNINAPRGLTINPAEKVARVARNEAEGLSFGKKFVEMTVARLPKIKKSYHSISVPTEDAVMTEMRLLREV